MKIMQLCLLLLLALPVIAAQYFSLEQSPLALISAILSLALLILVLGQVLASLKPGLLRNVAGLSLITLLGGYFFAQFVSYYLQGSYFNQQFYYHFNLRSVTETWSVYWPLVAMFLGWLICLWLCFLYFRNRFEPLKPSATTLTVLLVAALALDPGLRQSAVASLSNPTAPEIEFLTEIDWQQLKLNQEVLQNTEISATAGKNLVIVFMEGLDVIYTEDEIFPQLTPNLTQLNAEGWQLDNLVPMDGTGWTMGGIVSSLCGTPLIHDLGLDGNVIMFTGFLDQALCLPDVLNVAGYQQVFMGGASLNFGGKGEFFKAHHFDQVLGRDELKPRLADTDYTGGWGLFDDSLFDLAVEEFNTLAASGSPFNLTVLTVDTHHPTGEPSASCAAYPHIDNSILDAVHCTDYLVGKFIEQLKQHPAYEDTIVVLASDHLGMRNNAFSFFPEGYQRKLYFNVLNAQSMVPTGRLATPVDLAPTILSLLEVEHNTPFLAGGDLLEGEVLNEADAEIFADRQRAIKFINGRYLSSMEEERRLLYSLRRTRLRDLDFSQQVTDTELSRTGLRFVSTGSDPYFILPELTLESREGARLYVTLEVEQDSTFTLYYTSDEDPNYSEANTISASTVKGENRIVFGLDDIARTGRLRIDPGVNAGTFLLSLIEIRS